MATLMEKDSLINGISQTLGLSVRIEFKNGLLDIKRSLSCNCLPIQPILAGI